MLPPSPLGAVTESVPLGITFKFPIGLQELDKLSAGILLVLVVVAVAIGLAWFFTK